MFQPIFDFLYTIWNYVIFWEIIPEYENGILLRFGKYRRKITGDNGWLKTGLHFRLPLRIDECLTASIVTTTLEVASQSLTTKDNKAVSTSAIVKYHIFDVKSFLLSISDQYAAIEDITASKIKQVITDKDWSEINSDTDLKIGELVRSEVEKYGIKIEPKGITLKDIQVCRTLRLIQDSAPALTINQG
jgi:regulator of protease activity HflC (stomatin/prohibitin superfamily)